MRKWSSWIDSNHVTIIWSGLLDKATYVYKEGQLYFMFHRSYQSLPQKNKTRYPPILWPYFFGRQTVDMLTLMLYDDCVRSGRKRWVVCGKWSWQPAENRDVESISYTGMTLPFCCCSWEKDNVVSKCPGPAQLSLLWVNWGCSTLLYALIKAGTDVSRKNKTAQNLPSLLLHLH